jgi:hypothetical protein
MSTTDELVEKLIRDLAIGRAALAASEARAQVYREALQRLVDSPDTHNLTNAREVLSRYHD